MLIVPEQLNGPLAALAWIILLPVAWSVVSGGPWRALARDHLIHAFLGSTVILMVAWSMKASVATGLGFHFIGATVLTLRFGWRLAAAAMAGALLGSYVTQGGVPALFAANLLLKGVVPVLVTEMILRLAVRGLPRHVFVYIFVNAFLAAALAVLAQVAGIAGVLAMTGAYSPAYLVTDYLAFAPLMMFGEAWITGMLVAIFVSYRPQWLLSFDDGVYLNNKTP